MAKKIYVTRRIPEVGLKMLTDKGYEVDVNPEDKILSKEELVAAISAKPYDAVLPLLTDKIDGAVMDACPTAKIFANYAVGFDNIDVAAAKERGVAVTNTPGVLSQSVAEHAFALMIAVAKRVAEADKFIRSGQYQGWAPELLLGVELSGKTLGILGLGRIGSIVAKIAKGFDMPVLYYDVKQNLDFEKESGAQFRANTDDILKAADFVSVHVPLLDSTRHLINAERLAMMKPTAILVNTSRGPVVDEAALVAALKAGTIRGAGLDVYENEPNLTAGLADLPNVVLTPHTASATEEARAGMSRLAAENLIDFLEGKEPKNLVKG